MRTKPFGNRDGPSPLSSGFWRPSPQGSCKAWAVSLGAVTTTTMTMTFLGHVSPRNVSAGPATAVLAVRKTGQKLLGLQVLGPRHYRQDLARRCSRPSPPRLKIFQEPRLKKMNSDHCARWNHMTGSDKANFTKRVNKSRATEVNKHCQEARFCCAKLCKWYTAPPCWSMLILFLRWPLSFCSSSHQGQRTWRSEELEIQTRIATI